MADVFLYPGANPSDVRLTNPLANLQHAAIVGSGGLRASGAATVLRHARVVGSGGVKVSGAATVLRHVRIIGSGGVRVSGAATTAGHNLQHGSIVGAGGVIVGGSAIVAAHQPGLLSTNRPDVVLSGPWTYYQPALTPNPRLRRWGNEFGARPTIRGNKVGSRGA